MLQCPARCKQVTATPSLHIWTVIIGVATDHANSGVVSHAIILSNNPILATQNNDGLISNRMTEPPDVCGRWSGGGDSARERLRRWASGEFRENGRAYKSTRQLRIHKTFFLPMKLDFAPQRWRRCSCSLVSQSGTSHLPVQVSTSRLQPESGYLT